MDPPIEGRAGVARLEAFSDGVIAILITIMVLELKAPHEPGMAALLRLWPVFLAYGVSYPYIAIYWVNHHRLFDYARVVTNGLLWSNIALLFSISLVPFTTAYLGEQRFSQPATTLYLASLMLPVIAWKVLQRIVRRTGDQSAAAQNYHTATMRKGWVSTLTFSAGILLSLVSPWAGIACAMMIAPLWFLPWSRIDRLFLRGHKPEAE